jgi:hypothetical protein
MTRIMHRAGIGVTHGAGDGLSEFPSDLADAGTAGSAAVFSVQTSDASALVTLASFIRGSDAPALYMRVLVAVSVTAWAGASTAAAGTARPAHVLSSLIAVARSPGLLALFFVLLMAQFGVRTVQPVVTLFVKELLGDRPDLATLSGIAFSITGLPMSLPPRFSAIRATRSAIAECC